MTGTSQERVDSTGLVHPYGLAALRHVRAVAVGGPVDASLRVTLNFHPDRSASGGSVLDGILTRGVYLSQFVTGVSNGGLTGYPGGDRWVWERTMFGGAYDDAPADVRPVYGGLNFRRSAVGAAPRFGSAHLRLSAATLARSTFCYPDSVLRPRDFGVAERMSLIELARAHSRDALDDYVEAQVHGPVRIERDVEALVLDPSHRGTEVETLARRLPCPVEWHGGFRLSVAELRRHPEYRGRRSVELGAALAVDGRLDPRILGDAAGTGRFDPQDLKHLWHHLARFSNPG